MSEAFRIRCVTERPVIVVKEKIVKKIRCDRLGSNRVPVLRISI
jgi:hypothetical protein